MEPQSQEDFKASIKSKTKEHPVVGSYYQAAFQWQAMRFIQFNKMDISVLAEGSDGPTTQQIRFLEELKGRFPDLVKACWPVIKPEFDAHWKALEVSYDYGALDAFIEVVSIKLPLITDDTLSKWEMVFDGPDESVEVGFETWEPRFVEIY